MAAKQQAPRRRSESEWRAIVERFERSGMPTSLFCRKLGVSVKTLQFWRWKLRRSSSSGPTGLAEFIDVRPAVTPAASGPVPLPFGRWTIDVIFPDGTTTRMGG